MQLSLKVAVPLALVTAAVAASPAAAAGHAAPHAHAAGGAPVVLVYPSLVSKRVDRAELAMRGATREIEAGNVAGAALRLKIVRRQMSSAWRGAKYIIKNQPPPVVEEARVHARASDDDPTGPAYAAVPDTAFLVLTLQHDMIAATSQLIDGAHGTGLKALSTTLNFALDRRDKALQDVKALTPPAPPAEDARLHARASQEEGAVPTLDSFIPNIPPQLDDELQVIDGTVSDATDLTAGGKKLLGLAKAHITATAAYVLATWPPVPVDD
jgi:hypothetical protein